MPWMAMTKAAEHRGQSYDAIRTAVRRGKLDSRMGNDGKLEVLLPDDELPAKPQKPAKPKLSKEEAARRRVERAEAAIERLEPQIVKARARAREQAGKAEMLGGRQDTARQALLEANATLYVLTGGKEGEMPGRKRSGTSQEPV